VNDNYFTLHVICVLFGDGGVGILSSTSTSVKDVAIARWKASRIASSCEALLISWKEDVFNIVRITK
jgi:hypothetical protein